MEQAKLKTIRNLNKEITFLGLSPGFWLIFVVGLLVLILALKVYFLWLLPLLFYGAVKLEKLQKESTPKYLKAISDFKNMKKTFHDKRNLYKYL